MNQIRRTPILNRKVRVATIATTVAVLAVACGQSTSNSDPAAEQPIPVAPVSEATALAPTIANAAPSALPSSSPEPTVNSTDTRSFEAINPRPQIRSVDVLTEPGFHPEESIPRDSINPIYSPKFISAKEAGEFLLDDELVMGLNVNGDVRAYPVGIMRFREIVNDEVGGIPLLVTW